MLQNMVGKLADLGLSDKESLVYLTLLNEGSMAIDKIATQTRMNRSTTYVQLTDLANMGLISSHKQGKKIIFSAESPNNLERLLEKKALELEQKKAEVASFMPDLMRLFGSIGNRPVVRMFDGKEGLTAMRNSMIDKKPKLIYVISSIDLLRKVYSKKELAEYTKRRESLGIDTRVIYSSVSDEILDPYQHQSLRKVKETQLPFNSDTYIYDNCVSFASIGETIVGMTIENQGISDTMRAIFNVIWESLENK